MAFLLSDPRPQYRLDSGAVNAGGSLSFYATGTLTAKDVYSNSTLATSLGNIVTLDASGRTSSMSTAVPVFGDGVYRVIEKDAGGTTVNDTDGVNISGAAGAAPLDPATGTLDQVYSTDGTTALWRDVSEVPSVGGQSGKQLGNDGTTAFWEAKAVATVYTDTSLPGGITQGATSFQIGKLLVQTGSDTAPVASSQSYTTKATTFGTAFTTLLGVYITPTGTSGYTAAGANVSSSYTGSTTGFTVRFYAGQEHGGSDWYIVSSVPYTYVAFGLVA